jgi:DNA modification methylase
MTLTNPPWMPASVAHRALSDLKPYAGNARTHSAAQIAALAESIRRFGFPVPILIDSTGTIIAGHGRYAAAQQLNLQAVPVIIADHLTDAERRAYTLADNQLAAMSSWDADQLDAELRALATTTVDLSGLGFDDVLASLTPKAVPADQLDNIPDADDDRLADSVPGTVYHLGPHRLMCGDSTNADHVTCLCADGAITRAAALLHADPPYGMGKEADGVENDNLYHDKLDAFQMAWWRAWRPFLTDNGSAYIWGNPADLWRLWYAADPGGIGSRHGFGGLSSTERLTLRNEIVWDKDSAIGRSSEDMRCYPISTERCLFFMLGEQGFGNVNKEDFWSGFEPLRSHLEEQVKAMGWTPADVKRITGVGMYGHWFSKSQWHMIPERHYAALASAAAGKAFTRPYTELRHGYDGGLKTGGHLAAKAEFYGTRAYFDNGHDNMMEVWRFPRVTGADRHGHATPKPVAMIARAITSSCPAGGLVLEPFGGTGTTLIAAAETGRVCRTMELSPKWCDVIRRRWTAYAQAAGIDAGGGALV